MSEILCFFPPILIKVGVSRQTFTEVAIIRFNGNAFSVEARLIHREWMDGLTNLWQECQCSCCILICLLCIVARFKLRCV